MTEGRTSIPAFWIEMTKGDAAAFALPYLRRRSSVYGTRSPTRLRETI